MSPESISILFEALDFAAVKHQYLRRGGYDRLPYINHLIKVGKLIQDVGLGDNRDLMLVAILHDVMEDTATGFEEISARFGPLVARAVKELSDDMTLSYDERKRKQIENAAGLSATARVVRIADKICNIRDIMEYPVVWSVEKKLNYVDNSIAVAKEIEGTHDLLEELLQREASLARKKLEG